MQLPALLLSILGLYLPTSVAELPKKPNIIYILADDLGYFDVSYRNGSVVKTPNIESLANDGVKLERFYAQPSCMPSRSCLMMGRYQIHTGFDYTCLNGERVRFCMAPDTVTLPGMLKRYGYRTAMIGKWHLGHERKECVPTYKGFDSFFGYHAAAEDYFSHRLGTGRPECRDLWRNLDIVADDYANQYSTHLFTQEAQQIIRNQNPEEPLFMYLAYQAVHGPLQVPQQYFDMYKGENIDYIRRTYAAMATCMDEGIGNLTRTLKETGLWNNTIIVFSSDNGAQFHTGGRNWPLRGGKGTYWEGGVRVVSFVASPLIARPRRSSYDMMHMTDWLPTFVHLAGGTVAGLTLDGVNVWETISAGVPSPRKELLLHVSPHIAMRDEGTEAWYTNDIFEITRGAAIIVGKWKLVTGQNRSPRSWVTPPEYHSQQEDIPPPPTEKKGKMLFLFNLELDPNEEHDLSACRPDIVTKLLMKIRNYNAQAVYCSSLKAPMPPCLYLSTSVAELPKKPNIIYILADDLGYFDVSYRNGSVVKTPNIESLANDGVKLERFYAQPSCMPSRSCLMMGRYQIHTGFDFYCLNGEKVRQCMAPDTVTLPGMLKRYGYRTAMIGKWHLGHERKECVPTHKGFDSFFGYHAAAEDYYSHRFGAGRPESECRDLWRNLDIVADDYANQYSTHLFTQEAQQIIRNQTPEEPLFMYHAYQAVHGPLQVPQQYFDMYKGENIDYIRRTYAAMATCMDEGIGNLTRTLKETGLWNNTIIVFSSDNGAQFHTGGRNWPLRGGKGTYWEGGVRVVSFVASPLIARPRRSSYDMIHMTDWLPTFVHLAGGTVAGLTLDGVNVWETIRVAEIMGYATRVPQPTRRYTATTERKERKNAVFV
ncbi:arylsulfatase B-like isoform X2 [Ptychodera flava]|uniref:arylsulfatase B-like isoform X2 n=1 Tax=Ptychodera flava TaxID=63121 RepID=UPI00396AA8E0